jgi:anti-sigma regulatory factor (Ser/Thr protein kinase)
MLGDVSETHLEAVAASVTHARHVARDVAADLAPEVGDRLQLVVSELASNAVRHAHTPFCLTISADPTVRVEVADGNAAFPRPGTPDPWGEGGRGLMLVAACAQSWGVNRLGTGKVVWADLGPAR